MTLYGSSSKTCESLQRIRLGLDAVSRLLALEFVSKSLVHCSKIIAKSDGRASTVPAPAAVVCLVLLGLTRSDYVQAPFGRRYLRSDLCSVSSTPRFDQGPSIARLSGYPGLNLSSFRPGSSSNLAQHPSGL